MDAAKAYPITNTGLIDGLDSETKNKLTTQTRIEPGKARALIVKQESTIQALEARIKDLESELATAELSLARREILHNKEIEKLQERLSIYEPDGEPADTALTENIQHLRNTLQEKLKSLEEVASERVRIAVIESRLHAKPSFKTLAEKKDESARKTRDELRNDFIKRLNEEKAELSASLEAEVQKNNSLNKEIGDLRNMIAVLRSDLKKLVQEQVITQRAQNFEGVSPHKTSPSMSPPRPDDDSKHPYSKDVDRSIAESQRQRSRNSTQIGQLGSEKPEFSASGRTTFMPTQYTLLPVIAGAPANGSGPGKKAQQAGVFYGQNDILATIANSESPTNHSPTLCRSVGRGEAIRQQQEIRTLKQRLAILMRSIDDLKDELKCIIGATLLSIREAGLHHVLSDHSYTLTEIERLRFCGCLANNPPIILALIRLAQSAILPPRSQGQEPVGDTKITRRLPLLCTELDTRRLCGLEKSISPPRRRIEPVIPFDE